MDFMDIIITWSAALNPDCQHVTAVQKHTRPHCDTVAFPPAQVNCQIRKLYSEVPLSLIRAKMREKSYEEAEMKVKIIH